MLIKNRYAHLIENFDKLPDSAVLPTAVTAELFSLNPKTVRDRIPTVQLSPKRLGQRVGDLRAILKGKATTA
jgi:hypothetical protein